MLTRKVPMDYPAAIQAIAALEDRIREYQSHVDAGFAGIEFVITDAHRAAVAIRETWIDVPLCRYPADDTSPQLLQYQAEDR